MASSVDAGPDHPAPSVFLSYASEDRQAARRIGDALPAYGLEVWYDESELGGGDAWDQKIRRQIRECDFFMALVSAQTEARREGYFRREWRLAVERTLDMADDHTFILPIVIDETDQASARVPEKFLAVQWLRVPAGEPTPALEALCRRLALGDTANAAPAKSASARPRPKQAAPVPLYPQFPKEEPGQKTRFWLHVIGWAFQSTWAAFQRLPRWIRIIAYLWIVVLLLSKGCESKRQPSDLTAGDARKLKQITEQYRGSANKADVAKLGAQIAHQLSGDHDETEGSALLAIPFTAPSADAAGEKVADAAFAQVYGRVAISHSGHVGLAKDPLPAADLTSALARGRANHSTYILYGSVQGLGSAQMLTVNIATVGDGSVLWSKSYRASDADAAKVAADVDAKVPALDDD